MTKLNNIKRPNLKDYSRSFSLDNSLTTVNRKEYSKHLEMYVDQLESIMQLTAANLRDLAISLPSHPKESVAACHDLADRLYNVTIH